MFEVKIRNISKDIITHGPVVFETNGKADQWINEQSSKPNSQWGKPGEYEVIKEDVAARLLKEKRKLDKIRNGREKREECESAIDLIISYPSVAQAPFADALTLLGSYKRAEAKGAIRAVSPQGDETIREIKDFCLEILS